MSPCEFGGSRAGRSAPRGRPSGTLTALLLAAVLVPVELALTATPAGATVVPWMSLEEMTGEARVIVLGSVEGVESRWSEDGRIIVTRVTVSVERSLKGGPRARVVLEVPGGTIDGQTLVASGAPVFRRGERVVLFLQAPGEAVAPGGSGGPAAGTGGSGIGGPAAGTGGTGAAPEPERPLAVVGWSQGKLQVGRDPRSGRDLVRLQASGAAYLDRQGKPVAPERIGGGPVELEQLLRQVETLVRKGGAGGPP